MHTTLNTQKWRIFDFKTYERWRERAPNVGAGGEGQHCWLVGLQRVQPTSRYRLLSNLLHPQSMGHRHRKVMM